MRYLARFGAGPAWQAARMQRRGGSLAEMRLPGVAHPLWARTGTSDVATFDEIFLAREYELPFEVIAPARILDLGANVGYTAVYYASRWPGARILCVEPAEGNTPLLRRNTAAWPNISVLPAAVWSHAARVRVTNPGDDANAYRMGESPVPGEAVIPTYTVDQLMELQGWPRIDLLKMDVEGAEAQILGQADGWLDRVGLLVVELHDRIVAGCTESLCRALQGRRFRQEIVGRNLAIQFLPAGP